MCVVENIMEMVRYTSDLTEFLKTPLRKSGKTLQKKIIITILFFYKI